MAHREHARGWGLGQVCCIVFQLGQREMRRRAQRAHAARREDRLTAPILRRDCVVRIARAFVVVEVGILAGVVVREQQVGNVAGGVVRGRGDRAAVHGGVVPRLPVELAQRDLMLGQPVLDRVGRLGRVAAMKANAAQLRPGLALVGDHQRVAAEQGIGGVAAMLKVVIQPFFGQQAAKEVQVAFLILNPIRVRAVDRAVGQIKAKAHGQFAAALIVREQLGQDVDHACALKHPAVAAEREHRQRRFDHELVARKAAVGAEQTRLHDLTVNRAAHAAAGIGLPLNQRGLADQRGQVQVSVARQCGDAEGIARTRAAVRQRQVSQARPVGVGLHRQAACGREVGGQAE